MLKGNIECCQLLEMPRTTNMSTRGHHQWKNTATMEGETYLRSSLKLLLSSLNSSSSSAASMMRVS